MTSIVSVILVFLLASKKYNAEQSKERYEDLIYTSMKSIVSLNELVTELSVNVARVTTSLPVIKDDGEKTQKELDHTKTKIADIEDYAMRALEMKIDKLTTSLSLVHENIGEIQKDMKHLKTKIAHLEGKGINSLQKQIDQLTSSIADTNAKVDVIDGEVTLVSGEDDAGASKCVKVCAGSTDRLKTKWNTHIGYFYTEVDIRSCGFKKIPATVTIAIATAGISWTGHDASVVEDTITKTKFMICLKTSRPFNHNFLTSSPWGVKWIAVGYTC